MAIQEVFISKKIYENAVKSNIYALLYIFQNYQMGRIRVFAGPILALTPYV